MLSKIVSVAALMGIVACASKGLPPVAYEDVSKGLTLQTVVEKEATKDQPINLGSFIDDKCEGFRFSFGKYQRLLMAFCHRGEYFFDFAQMAPAYTKSRNVDVDFYRKHIPAPVGARWLEFEQKGTENLLLEKNLLSGDREVLYRSGAKILATYRPDGKSYLILDGNRLYLMRKRGLAEEILNLTGIEEMKLSPDGRFLVWRRQTESRDLLEIAEIFQDRLLEKRLLVDRAAKKVGSFDWHPDSRHLMVALRNNGSQDLYLLRTDAERTCMQTWVKHPKEDTFPAFSQDARYVAWIRDRQLLVAPFELEEGVCEEDPT